MRLIVVAENFFHEVQTDSISVVPNKQTRR